MAEIFYNIPGIKIFDYGMIVKDIIGAKDKLAIAAGWFTKNDYAIAFRKSFAKEKIVFFNEPDLEKGLNGKSKHASVQEMILRYKKAPGSRFKIYAFKNNVKDPSDPEKIIFKRLHMKTIVIDNKIAWVNTGNPTLGSELCADMYIRFTDVKEVNKIWDIIYEMEESEYLISSELYIKREEQNPKSIYMKDFNEKYSKPYGGSV